MTLQSTHQMTSRVVKSAARYGSPHLKLYNAATRGLGLSNQINRCAYRSMCALQTTSLARSYSSTPLVSQALDMKVYTRTGDSGTSQLFSGERRLKTDQTFEALGAVDELNSLVGLAREFALRDSLTETATQLEEIMSRLFDVGAAIATPLDASSTSKIARAAFDEGTSDTGDSSINVSNRFTHTAELEGWIDEYSEILPPLKNFVLPSGGLCSAQLHVARSVCRRAERAVIPLVQRGALEASVSTYLNRLSDFLFMSARTAAMKKGYKEVVWQKGNPPAARAPSTPSR